ncbi:phosphatidylserine/phosphatidylglycerophosphate/cardiolipin synthase family protein [Paraferrimonas sp. SM1919]|uniref:phospholipase D-like domain-containing protein n=1 Tax=Paraferrimonas sp. SM1919 TaxID=2662263 RepID=UPI0013D70789|nr:phospholipase D family protein [Paraferrimonas sp. SM1919]
MKLIKFILLLGCFLSLENAFAKQALPIQYANHQCELNNAQPALTELMDVPQNSTAHLLLEDPQQAMLYRAWLTDTARKTLDVQYFIFTLDNIGTIALEHLVRAADNGVKVRLLIDDIMLNVKSDSLKTLQSHPNISIKVFNPMLKTGKNIVQQLLGATLAFTKFNKRMHNKTFIQDGQVAITGGRNIADEYFGYDKDFNFIDRDILVIGETANDISQSFEHYWQARESIAVDKLIGAKNYNPEDFESLYHYSCDPANFAPSVRNRLANMPKQFEQDKANLIYASSQFYYDPPSKNDTSITLSGGSHTLDILSQHFAKAEKEVIIHTPYLITTKEIRKLIKTTVARGVEVKILTNSMLANDNHEAFSGYQRNRKSLLETGAQIFEFKPDPQIKNQILLDERWMQLDKPPVFGLHSKTMVIDRKHSFIGTYNFDPRSAHLNTECFVHLDSVEFAQQLMPHMLAPLAPENAWQVTNDFNPDQYADFKTRVKVLLRRWVPKSIL